MTTDKSLGISIAKIASTSENIPPKVLRFMLQSAARELLPNERVAKCLRTIVPTAQRVEIHKSHEKHSAHYRNLLVCGRVWHCPVCSQKISEERRKELSTATLHWTGGLVLVTYTLSHSNAAQLQKTLSQLTEAYRFFKSGRVFNEICAYNGWLGSVKALEITHGKNGWHPHIHELIFTTNVLKPNQITAFENQVGARWRISCKHVSAFASTERGVTLKTSNADVSEYVSKFGEAKIKSEWTFAHELTKQVVKRGKMDGRSPTQLLYDYMLGDKLSGSLWVEYAHILKGRHQLVWSRGMRHLLKMGSEETDENLAEKSPENSVMLASLTRGQWYDVLSHDAVGSILHAADTKDEEEFKAWLSVTLAFWADV